MPDIHYSEEDDIFSIAWDNGAEYRSSIEIYGKNVIVDIDKQGNVKGFEFFNFSEECVKGQNEINKMLDRWNKRQKNLKKKSKK